MKRREGLKEQPMQDELMLLDEAADKVHVLNATSACIWQALGETTDVSVIATRLRERFKLPADRDLTALIEKALTQLREKRLVIDGAG